MAEENGDLEVVEQRRRSLMMARENLEKAREEAAKHVNAFGRAGFEHIKSAGLMAQLVSSKKWYNFWEKPSKVPKELQLSDGTRMAWSDLRTKLLDDVRQLTSPSAGFDKPYKKAGATIQSSSTERTTGGVPMIRVTKEVAAKPYTVLLSQIRCTQKGAIDPALLYEREHFKFRGGQTFIFHSVKAYGTSMIADRDFVTLLTWDEDEDGTIFVAASSVQSIKPNVVAKTVRGERLLFGMKITPKKVTKSSLFSKAEVEGSEVVVLNHTNFKGYVLAFVQKNFALNEVMNFFSNVESFSEGLEKSGSLEDLIAKFVMEPEADDREEAKAAEAASEAAAEMKAEAEAAAAVGIEVTNGESKMQGGEDDASGEPEAEDQDEE